MDLHSSDIIFFGFPLEDNSTLMTAHSFPSVHSPASEGIDCPDKSLNAQVTYDFSQLMYMGQRLNPSLVEVILKVSLYSVVIGLSLVGNSLVIYIVWRNKRMHTTTNYFLVNLAVSDVMVTSFCSWVYLVDNLTEGWVLGSFFCRFNSFAQVVSLVSSILTLILIACDRFFGIVFAMKAHITERRSTLFIAFAWLCSIGVASPLIFYREQFTRHWSDHVETWCDDTWPATHTCDPATKTWTVSYPTRALYYTLVSTVLFACPILVMTFVYSSIIWKLWSSRVPGERTETEIRHHDNMKKKVIIMLLILLTVFTACWLPIQVAILYAEFRPLFQLRLPDWYSPFYFFANYFAHANSAFNPLIYAGFNENFRRGFKNLFRCRRKPNRNHVYGRTRNISTIGLQRTASLRSFTIVSKI